MKLDIAAIKRRADAATTGPWHRVRGLMDRYWTLGRIRDHVARPLPADNAEADWTFAEAAREDVPALCARVEALEAALRAAEEQLCSLVPGNSYGLLDHAADRERQSALAVVRRALEGEP